MSGFVIPVGGGHLADELLMQLLDGTSAPAEARDHLSGCQDCSTRYTALENASALLRASLPDVPMPRLDLRAARRRRPWVISVPMAAAATFVLLASAAAATPPLRHWILRQVSPDPAPVVESQPVPVATRAAGVIASFAPSDTTLVIRVDRSQSSGFLEIDAAAGDRVSAQAIGGGATEEMIVLPGQLRIANGRASTADYRITVPLSVRALRVLIDGDDFVVIRTDSILHRRIDLR